MTLTALSLFSGVGGLDLGLDRAGFNPILMCEADAYKRSVLAAHWPEVPIHDDVRTLLDVAGLRLADGGDRHELGDRYSVLPVAREVAGACRVPVDVVHGGFPCQDVSVAGKRAGLAGQRTGLYFDALRIVDALRPRSVLVENVPGLLSSNSGRDFGVVLAELADRGYGVAYRVLDAQHFGVPQRRRRVFVLALAGDDPRAAAQRAADVLAIGKSGSGHPTPRDEARPRVAARAGGGARNGRVAHTLKGAGHDGSEDGSGRGVPIVPVASHAVAPTLTKSGGGQNQNADATQQAYVAYRKSARVNADPDSAETWVNDGRANTLNRFDVGDVRTTHAIVEPAATSVRRLTPIECERLMGWPDNWTAPPGVRAPDSRRYAACGDGVVAPVAEWIGRRLAQELDA